MSINSIDCDEDQYASLAIHLQDCLRNGNPSETNSAMEEVVKYCRPHVVRLLRHRGAKESDIEDIVQNIFLLVFRKIKDLQNPQYLRTWVLTTTVRQHINYALRNKNPCIGFDQLHDDYASYIPDYRTSTIDEAETNESITNRMSNVHKSVTKLRPQLGYVFKQHYEYGLSLREIAEATQRPIGTIKRWLFEAREQIKEDAASSSSK